MTNDILVHLNGINKMGDFRYEERYLHLSFSVLLVKSGTIILSVHQEMYLIQSLNHMACTTLLGHAALHVHSV